MSRDEVVKKLRVNDVRDNPPVLGIVSAVLKKHFRVAFYDGRLKTYVWGDEQFLIRERKK
jgi:hypothetical protein